MPNRVQRFIQRIVGIQPTIIKQTNTDLRTPAATVRAGSGLIEVPPIDMQTQMQWYKSWVYAAVRKNATEIAKIELKLFEKKGDGAEEIKKHEVWDLLDNVNNFQTRYDLFEWLGTLWGQVGECYWWKQRNAPNKIVSIYSYLNPANMDVVPSAETFIKGFAYTVPGTNKTIPFDKKDMIQFKLVDPANAYRGISPLKAAEVEVSTDEKAAKFNWNFFKNSAKPYGAIQTDSNISADKLEYYQTQFNNNYGTDNEKEHKIMLLEGGLKWENVGIPQKDMEFMLQRKFSRDHIFSLYGIPPALMFPESSNRAVSESAERIYLKNTIKPYYAKIVSTLNEYLLAEEGFDNLFFDFVDPVPKDKEAKARTFKIGIDAGYLTRNEARVELNLPPVKGGDELYRPINVQPVGQTEPAKAKHEFNVKRLRRTEKEIIEDTTKEVMDKYKSKIDEKSLELVRRFDKNFKELRWKQLVQGMDGEENFFKQRLIPALEKQERKVLASLNKKEVKVFEFEFGIDAESKIFVALFEPFIRNLIAEHGEDTYNMLGIDPLTFVSASANVESYIKREGLKFAKEINKTTKEKIKKQLIIAEQEGEGIQAVRRRIESVFTEAKTSRAFNIARSEVARSDNFAITEAYKQSGVVVAKEWFTALDERVCPYCRPLHGKVVSIDKNYFNKGDSFLGEANTPLVLNYEAIGEPPLHSQCRCTTLPVVKSIR